MTVVADGAHHHQFVILTQPHSHKAGFAAAGVERSRGALNHAALGDKEEELVFGKFPQGQHRGDPFPFLQRQQIVDMHALGRAAALGHLVHLELVHAPLVSKQAKILVVGGGEKFLHIVVFRRMQGRNALAAALLLLVVFQRRALHVPAPRKGNDHFVVRNQVLNVYAVEGLAQHFRTPGRGKGIAEFRNLFFKLPAQHFRIVQHRLIKLDFLQQILVLGHKLIALQAREPLQTHIQNGPGL